MYINKNVYTVYNLGHMIHFWNNLHQVRVKRLESQIISKIRVAQRVR